MIVSIHHLSLIKPNFYYERSNAYKNLKDLHINFANNMEVFQYFKYIYVEFNRIYQSGMIYYLHLECMR